MTVKFVLSLNIMNVLDLINNRKCFQTNFLKEAFEALVVGSDTDSVHAPLYGDIAIVLKLAHLKYKCTMKTCYVSLHVNFVKYTLIVNPLCIDGGCCLKLI